jgi:hypothetical protein
VDRNGNGDLTEEGERVVGEKAGLSTLFEVGGIIGPGGRVKHTELLVQFHDQERWTLLVISVNGKGRQAASLGERSLRFAARPEDAPIIHLGCPLTIRLVQTAKVDAGKVFVAEIGTPGLGVGTFATIDPQEPGVIPKGICPVAEITYSGSKPGGQPVCARIALNRREH